MEEPPAKETPEQGLNKIDLSQLQDFRFGTQWTEVKSAPGPRREGERDRAPRREGPERGEGRPRDDAGGEARRDRRGFRRPAGTGGPAPSGPGDVREGPHQRGGGRPGGEFRPREDYRGSRPPGREGGGERRWSGPRPPQDYRPYQSPYFNVAFYPEDAGFTALVKAMRTSCRTFELFEIARLIIGKYERFVVVLSRRAPEAVAAPEAPAGTPLTPPVPAKPAGPVYVALPDGMPFETEDAAIAHVVGRHLDKFFDLATVEVEPPKGNFPFVNRCTLSGELLGPPNYHRYQQIVQQHHATRYPGMPFEAFRERIETVRDPEVVNQWLEKMKRAKRYTWKLGAAGEAPVEFDNLEDARAHLQATARDRMVKAVEAARFHAKLLEALTPGEIRRAIEGHLERQRRFPLDTANALRGRLRREGFTIFKKGAKGISYVCAVKRKFRVPGQVFAESIGALTTFIEVNPMITVKDLPVKFLGITPPPTPSTPPLSIPSTPPIPTASTPPISTPSAPAVAMEPTSAVAAEPAPPPPAPAEPAPSEPAAPPPPAPAPAAEAAPAPAPLTPEQQEKLRRMTIDLRWLVQEGYVTEFGDGRLFAPPPMAEARIKSAESPEGEEHDLESFPEVPAPATAATPEAGQPPPEAADAPPAATEAPAAGTESERAPPTLDAAENPPPVVSDAPVSPPADRGVPPATENEVAPAERPSDEPPTQ
ncbi:MAG TPA: hypothetical protein VLT83_07370 [Opitutaceae bacterium]|nr:hypothetical protein [Opitutaceae bacterium]